MPRGFGCGVAFVTPRQQSLAACLAGALWALAVVWIPQLLRQPFFPIPVILPIALGLAGLTYLAMVARGTLRRVAGLMVAAETPQTGSGRHDQVIRETGEQVVLALALWPFVALVLGGYVVLWMGIAFVLSRAVFWVGVYKSKSAQLFGMTATLIPTLLAALWALVVQFS